MGFDKLGHKCAEKIMAGNCTYPPPGLARASLENYY